jgi:hypothetical protein
LEIKVDWLAAGASQRVSGVLFLSFPAIGVPNAKSLSQWEASSGGQSYF